MKKKIMNLVLMISVVLLLTGCLSESISENETKNANIYIQDSYSIDIYIDKETCVEYIRYAGANRGGITLRLNADGTLKLNDGCIKEINNE